MYQRWNSMKLKDLPWPRCLMLYQLGIGVYLKTSCSQHNKCHFSFFSCLYCFTSFIPSQSSPPCPLILTQHTHILSLCHIDIHCLPLFFSWQLLFSVSLTQCPALPPPRRLHTWQKQQASPRELYSGRGHVTIGM